MRGKELKSRITTDNFSLFPEPTKSTIRFIDIEALLIAIGAKVSKGSGSRMSFWHGVEEWHAHHPHPGKEAKKYQVEGVREFLERLEI
ncbi:MAG: type II toxin-antitoxin system HicA family toxin [Pseudomonadota bacterium]